jgi:hypothetical protein
LADDERSRAGELDAPAAFLDLRFRLVTGVGILVDGGGFVNIHIRMVSRVNVLV